MSLFKALVFLAVGTATAVVPDRTVDLFKSTDLANWEYLAGSPADVAQVVSVKDGVIAVTGKPNGYIGTRKSYSDYSLHLEWRWTDTAPASRNGGVLLNIASGPVQQGLWPTSFQVQIKTDHEGDVLNMGDARFVETPTTLGTATSPSSTLARRQDVAGRAPGEWNSVDVVVSGSIIEISMNGVPQNRITGCNPSSGRIGFQFEGHPFQLRDVKISPLPKARN